MSKMIDLQLLIDRRARKQLNDHLGKELKQVRDSKFFSFLRGNMTVTRTKKEGDQLIELKPVTLHSAVWSVNDFMDHFPDVYAEFLEEYIERESDNFLQEFKHYRDQMNAWEQELQE